MPDRFELRTARPLSFLLVRVAEGAGRASVRSSIKALRENKRRESETHSSAWTKRPLGARRLDRRRVNRAAKLARRKARP